MSAEADALCNAEYDQVSDERVNHRNGYRPREWDTRAGTVELAMQESTLHAPDLARHPYIAVRYLPAPGSLNVRGDWAASRAARAAARRLRSVPVTGARAAPGRWPAYR